MQMTFRIECPNCNWGHEFKNSYINQGYLKTRCQHCKELFFFKIIVGNVHIDVTHLPPDVPYTALPDKNVKEDCGNCVGTTDCQKDYKCDGGIK